MNKEFTAFFKMILSYNPNKKRQKKPKKRAKKQPDKKTSKVVP